MPVAYNYSTTGKRPKSEHTAAQKHHGFIAQEVEAVLEDHGHDLKCWAGISEDYDEDGERWLGMKYEQMIAPMVKAIQELKAELDELKEKVNA